MSQRSSTRSFRDVQSTDSRPSARCAQHFKCLFLDFGNCPKLSLFPGSAWKMEQISWMYQKVPANTGLICPPRNKRASNSSFWNESQVLAEKFQHMFFLSPHLFHHLWVMMVGRSSPIQWCKHLPPATPGQRKYSEAKKAGNCWKEWPQSWLEFFWTPTEFWPFQGTLKPKGGFD